VPNTILERTQNLLLGKDARPLDAFLPFSPDPIKDQGAHNMPLEWWYTNARLTTADGEDVSLAFAIFQILLPNGTPFKLAHFFPQKMFVGHYSVTSVTHRQFRFEERSSFALAHPRVRVRQGYAKTDALDVGLGDWRLWRSQQGQYRAQFSRHNQDLADLTMTPTRPEVAHAGGWVGKQETTGRMYYHSATRCHVAGTLRGQPVQGIAWLDHQWGGENGIHDAVFEPRWDWLSINLEDGRDIMAYRLRDAQNQILEQAASVTMPNGANRLERVAMNPTRHWQAPTGANYPIAWAVQLEDGTDLWVESVLDAQELDARITVGHPYYEGATNISGDAQGTGFMELPGYTTMPNIIKKPFEWLFDQFRRGTRL
jgi:predicted secreted hydrolase